MHGRSGGTQGIDNDFASKSFENVAAWLLDRMVFGPVRGPWEGDSGKGGWGNNPSYHTPVFVLTHYGRAPREMEDGTRFHFVTDGIESALGKTKAVAMGKDVFEAKSTNCIWLCRQCCLAKESLFAGINLSLLGYNLVKSVAGENATHILIEKHYS